MNICDSKVSRPALRVTVFQVLLALIFMLTFVISFIVAPFHVEGDQVHYSKAYKAIAGLGILEAQMVYKTIIYTTEPIHFFIIWIFSSLGVEKNLLMAFANAVLSVLFAKVLHQKGAGFLMVIWITFSCYYLYTMFFTLERTKFAFIFVLLYLLSGRRVWVLISIFTHNLMLIPVGLNILGHNLIAKTKNQKKNSYKYSLKVLKIFVSAFILFLLYNSFSVHLYYKFLAYYHENLSNEYFEGWASLVLCGVTLMSARNKKIVILFYCGLLLLAFLMGSSRINMIGYFTFLYFSNFQHQAFKVSVVMFGLYLQYKTFLYLGNIYYFGG